MMQLIKNIPLTSVTILLFVTIMGTALLRADTDNGMISIPSSYDVKTTIDRLESALNDNGMTIFKRVDHTAGASKAGMQLRPTELLIFGNLKVGTPLMHCSQTIALDLPQKALAYQDEQGKVWLVYNDPTYLAGRHGISDCDRPLQKVSKALGNFARFATSPASE
jgi:uncharacterized protein (DUF302 family)